MRTPSSRRRRGTSILEASIGVVIALGVLGVAVRLTQSSTDLAQSAAARDVASRRVQKVLSVCADSIRSSSLAALQRSDASTFADGASDTGVSVQRVIGAAGTNRLADRVTLRLDRPGGAAEGEVVRAEGGITQKVAEGVTELTVRRSGDAFTITCAAQGDARSDMNAVVRRSVTVRTRNP